MRSTLKSIISILLVMSMLALLFTPAMAQTPSDISGHWAQDQFERWIRKGIIAGYGDGTVRPDKNITRAEFVSILGRVLRFGQSAENPFRDVPETAWYAKDVSGAAASGIISGDGKGYFSPEEPISRQQAAVILARAFCLTANDEDVVKSFRDHHKIAAWGKAALSALVENGYMAGKAGKLIAPEDKLTRAEFVVLLDRIAGELKNSEGIYSGTIEGNLSVNCSDVTLKDMTVKGDLFLLDGIGEGNVTLDNVTVEGRTVVKGGGENSILISNSSIMGTLLVVKINGKVRIVAKGDAFIPECQLASGAVLEEDNVTDKGFHNIEVLQTIEPGSVIVLDGDFEEVTVDAPDANISIISGTVGDLIITENAQSSNVEIKEGAVVHTLTANAGITVKGSGDIRTARINANGVTIDSRPGSIQIADGVEANIGGSVVRGGGSGNTGGSNSGSTPNIGSPSDLRVSLSAFDTAQLYWNQVRNAESYNIYRSESLNGEYIKINTAPVRENKYKDTGLLADTTYYYKVTAVASGRESAKSGAKSVTTPESVQEGQWKLIWSDEFDGIPGTGADRDKWVYEVAGDGFGNNELQYTTDRTENVFISNDPNDPDNGLLVIQALKEKYNGKDYTSGRIKTEGKFDFTYGKVEMRARLPLGKGIGSAFWMLGSNYKDIGWPNCGEIDIMENVGQYPDRIFGTIHGPGYSAGESIGSWHEHSEGFTDDFHTYTVEWEPNVIRWYFDGQLYEERTPEDLFGKDWVFDHDFFIILGLGVGGTWPGDPDDTTIFPQKFTIDYVRVYQREGDSYPEFSRKNLIQIRNAGNGKYVCADEYNGDYLYANRDSASLWETFELVDLGNNNVALIGLNTYKYVSSESDTSKLIAASETVGGSETFELIENPDDTVSLKCKANNKFVAAEDSGILSASADDAGGACRFIFISYSVPDAPSGLKADALTNSSVTLSWQAASNATGYNLYRSDTQKGPYSKINTTAITDTAFTDRGLEAGKTYYYKVAAVNNVGQSLLSAALSVEIPVEPTTPPAPDNLAMTSGSGTSVLIMWDPVPGAKGYNVYRATGINEEYVKVNGETVGSPYYEDTGLSAATKYYYKVTAVNESGESERSEAVFATTSGFGIVGDKQYSYIISAANSRIIEADENDGWVPLKATANEVSSDRQLFEIIYTESGAAGIASKQLNQLVCADSWTVPDYQLLPRTGYSTDPGSGEQFTIVPQGDGTVAIIAANGGKYVRVDPATGILKADKSTTVGINEKFIIVTPKAPGKPTDLTATDILDTSATLNWKAPRNCVLSGYNIYRAASGGEYERINDSPVTELSFTDTGLTAGTQYNYKVVAFNIRGESESAEITVTTLAGPIPEKPEGVDLTINPDGSVILSWEVVQGALGYNVYRASGRFGNYQQINEITVIGSSFTVSDEDAHKYYYKIKAVNENSESRFSDPVSQDIKLFGPNVYIFDPSDAASEIQNIADSVYEEMRSADTAQFGSGRYALLFKPGAYTTDVKVGYYTHVAGLGRLPTDTIIPKLTSEAALENNNSTCNFWRSAENLTVNSNTQWAVSQAVSLRRVKINGELSLHQAGGWASGGFLADSYITGNVIPGSQQQWFSRNTYWNTWNGGVWNMVFVGIADGKAPQETWPEKPFTTVEYTPVIKEKPFLYIDDGDYYVFAPDLRKDSKGLSWSESDMGPGNSIPIEDFYVAHSDIDTADTINNALAEGKHLLLTPGIYNLDKPIEIDNENTVVLGLGLATLTAVNGNACMKIADVDGVMVAGLLFDAGEEKSEVLLEVGPEDSSADHSENPTVLSDLYFRVGGRNEYTGKADTCIIVNSNNVIGDNFWVWRADHGYNIKWDTNVTRNGIVVNGDDVTMYALMVEHFHEYQTLWNGNNGRTYFYQSELPYDVPDQESWMSHNGTKNGYASYKVADEVTSHEAWGLGVYSYHRDAVIDLHSAIEVPDHKDVKIHNACTVMLAGNPGISHVVNDEGGAVIKSGNRQEVIYYCNNGAKTSSPVFMPKPGTYALPINVVISSNTQQAVIRYTTDNSEPTEASPVYKDPVTVDQDTVIKAKAFKEGLEDSDTVTAVYKIDKTAVERNLLVNGTFDTGSWEDKGWGNYSIDGWTFWSGEGADGVPSIEDGMVRITHTSSDGENNWNTQLKQQGIKLDADRTYVLCFDILSTITRPVDVCVENSGDTAIKYLQTQTFVAGPERRTYSFEFKSGSVSADAQVVLLLGGSNRGNHSISIDNVYLWEKDVSAPGQVKTPVFNISSGTYFAPQEIQITCATDDATIYYTLDGTEPAPDNGMLYDVPFVVSENTVIKAIAVKPGMEDSLVSSITLKFTDNFALNKPAIASSGNAALAFDGNPDSRWESEHSDPQWIMVDLGSTVIISGVKIAWEYAAGKVYDIKVSDDADAWNNNKHPSWNTVHSVTNGTDGQTLEVFFPPKTGRYVMVYGTERTTTYGYSIYEFEVYANKVATPVITVDDTDPTAKKVMAFCVTEGATIRYTIDGSEPTNESNAYTDEAITITSTTTVKFRAYKDGMSPSNVVTEIVVIKVPNPTITYTPEDLSAAEKTVTITSTEGADIWYTTDGTDPSLGHGELYSGPFMLTETTTIKAIACKTGMEDSDIVSILVKFNDNIARGKTAEASSANGANTAALAFDGNAGTRWESVQNVDPQWITVDLGANCSIRKIRIVWEPACAKDYTIDISEDNENWTTIITKTDMPSPHTMDETLAEPVVARYVRMNGTARATGWGYSIYEFEIYGTLITPSTPEVPAGLTVEFAMFGCNYFNLE